VIQWPSWEEVEVWLIILLIVGPGLVVLVGNAEVTPLTPYL
jgi:hypothetical protein